MTSSRWVGAWASLKPRGEKTARVAHADSTSCDETAHQEMQEATANNGDPATERTDQNGRDGRLRFKKLRKFPISMLGRFSDLSDKAMVPKSRYTGAYPDQLHHTALQTRVIVYGWLV